MEKIIELQIGNIYYLDGYTAPKVFTGSEFECLLTEQQIDKTTKVKSSTGFTIKNWPYQIYKNERFLTIQ